MRNQGINQKQELPTAKSSSKPIVRKPETKPTKEGNTRDMCGGGGTRGRFINQWSN